VPQASAWDYPLRRPPQLRVCAFRLKLPQGPCPVTGAGGLTLPPLRIMCKGVEKLNKKPNREDLEGLTDWSKLQGMLDGHATNPQAPRPNPRPRLASPVNPVAHLSDWEEVERLLASHPSRTPKSKDPEKPDLNQGNPMPTLKELDKAADWGKVKSLLNQSRVAAPQPPPANPEKNQLPAPVPPHSESLARPSTKSPRSSSLDKVR
jgi:hypothetical protein